MDKYEARRLALQSLISELGRGATVAVAKAINKEPSYISRMLYSPDRRGAKRIGEDTLEMLRRAYPSYFSGNPEETAKIGSVLIPALEESTSGSVMTSMSVALQWIHQHIECDQVSALRFSYALGDSMVPTVGAGDLLLIDTSSKDIASLDGIYALKVSGIKLKRIRSRVDSTIELSSDNPAIKTVEVIENASDVVVLGRVVWAWSGKKL